MVGRFFGRCRSGRRTAVLALGAMVAVAGGLGCADFLNPSLLRLFETSADGGNVTFAGVNPPTGHVPILFKNTARIADNVFRFIIQGDTVVRPEVVDELLRENPQLSREEIENILQAIIDAVLEERSRCATVVKTICSADKDLAHKIADEIRRNEEALIANLSSLR